jgi:hypothetical protein
MAEAYLVRGERDQAVSEAESSRSLSSAGGASCSLSQGVNPADETVLAEMMARLRINVARWASAVD